MGRSVSLLSVLSDSLCSHIDLLLSLVGSLLSLLDVLNVGFLIDQVGPLWAAFGFRKRDLGSGGSDSDHIRVYFFILSRDGHLD